MASKLKEVLREYDYKSTVSAMEEFKKSFIWQDVQLFLQEVIDLYKDVLVNSAMTPDLLFVRELQGRVDELRILLNLPDILLDDMKMKIEDEKNLKEEERNGNNQDR